MRSGRTPWVKTCSSSWLALIDASLEERRERGHCWADVLQMHSLTSMIHSLALSQLRWLCQGSQWYRHCHTSPTDNYVPFEEPAMTVDHTLGRRGCFFLSYRRSSCIPTPPPTASAAVSALQPAANPCTCMQSLLLPLWPV